jgi:IclR family pca regulon transcriptional regulator
MTLTEVAARTGLSRGTARRLLLTLRALSYIDTDGRLFWLTPKVLNFSNAYLMPLGLGDAAKAVIKGLTERLNESSSIGVLDGPDVVYVARIEVRRLYSSGIDVGTRLPAHCSSLGRMLLASLPDERLAQWLAQHPLQARTPKTITDPDRFREELAKVRRQRFALIDEELEVGIRSVAVPIVGQSGRTFAALNASASTARVGLDTLADAFVPRMHDAARALSAIMNW